MQKLVLGRRSVLYTLSGVRNWGHGRDCERVASPSFSLSCSAFQHRLSLILIWYHNYHPHLASSSTAREWWRSLFTGSAGEVLAVLPKIWYFMPRPPSPNQPTAILLLTIFANILLVFSWCFFVAKNLPCPNHPTAILQFWFSNTFQLELFRCASISSTYPLGWALQHQVVPPKFYLLFFCSCWSKKWENSWFYQIWVDFEVSVIFGRAARPNQKNSTGRK